MGPEAGRQAGNYRAPLARRPQHSGSAASPGPERLRELREQRDFQYVEVKSEQSSWDLFWARVMHWLSGVLSTRGGKIVWEYGIYALLVVALVFVVLKLMQVDLTRAFGRAPRTMPMPYDTTTEDIHGLDFDALLTEAEAVGNYRLAVRLGYLFVLKQLTDQGLIQWQPDKTNHDYLQELKAGQLRPAFRELTQQFEYVWYGEQQDLPLSHYTLARDVRVAFQRQLSTVPHAA
ncbi:DUF4129 domain-containing protein [Hymenobacter cellulosilyticus]|uniref:DUF4129 domain-containing protein n=1 Tax=Hymenobacter cellulosilyticus TaxID=2932248 RepID=A0A8T9QAX8_9BACT|nr:DUF4129 domain-containing protein [Hymenobacter cellulosilyticus]UOQ72023.1 DUF4129 domain-containing protein [Hymenobacter cellulosilyticus]